MGSKSCFFDVFKQRMWIVIGAAALTLSTVLVIALGFILNSSVLRAMLARMTVIALDLSLTCTVIGLFLSFDTIKNLYRSVPSNTKRALLGTLIIAVVLVTKVAPRTNRILFDEQIYQNIAQSICHTGRAMLANEGRAEHGNYLLNSSQYNKQPSGHPYYLSLFFSVLGVHEWAAHLANNLAYLLALVAIFGTTLLSFGCHLSALMAATFYALTPQVVIWSNTTSAEPAAAAFSALAVFATALFCARPTPGTLLLTAGLGSFSVYFRPESVLVLAPIAFLILINRPTESNTLWLVLLTIALTSTELLHLYAVRNEDWGTTAEKMSLAHFYPNLIVNGLFYLDNQRFPAVFTVLGLAACLLDRHFLKKVPIALWFLLTWGVFLFFYAGSYNYGADVRYSLISAPPLAILAGLGGGTAVKQLSKYLDGRKALTICTLIIALLWIRFLPVVRALGEEGIGARLDVEYARKLSEFVPSDSMVFTHNPNMWLVWGKNAAQVSTAVQEQNRVARYFLPSFSGGVYFHWNYWCQASVAEQTNLCEAVMRDYRVELIKEFKEARFRFALYRLFLKES